MDKCLSFFKIRLVKCLVGPSIIAITLIQLCLVGASQDTKDSRIFGGPERKFFNAIPDWVPVKVKARKVASEKWAHDLEIEITNISSKPIYYMHLYLTLPGVRNLERGHRVGFLLRYGRSGLISAAERVRSDDVPIMPKGKHVFRLSENGANGWEQLRAREGRPQPKILELEFQLLNFGDGTGYITTGGEPFDVRKRN